MPQAKARLTARGVVIHNGKVALIERWRKDSATGKMLHYFSIPGGMIEPGETAEAAVVRELFEETSLLVRTERLIATQYFDDGSQNSYFLCAYLSGKPKLHSSLPEHQSESNRSEPVWVSAKDLSHKTLNGMYEPIRTLIEAALKGQLGKKPLIV